MSQVVAGLYEILRRIGAGGGGIVYLGWHLRLKKHVVLKADKRTLSVGLEKLEREVQMLKNLSHSYIPQVYDFVQENGVCYTVMDFIEGESLDKPLGRRESISQPQVIGWACQLLEALVYLHSRPPYGILHGDIKPANVMVRPGGDVCLIDFNIALALGEDGAVKVGSSRGYASPEHYGADYIKSNRSAAVQCATDVRSTGSCRDTDQTLVDEDTDRTQIEEDTDRTLVEQDTARISAGSRDLPGGSGGSAPLTGSTTGSHRGILLDVRSDIYSLGATLYHLLSGRRPAQDARDVVPLGAEVCSPAVSVIIQKAMAPDPADRYQTAEEMLTAFLLLHKRDSRVLRHKRRKAVSAALLSVMFLAGGASTFVGLRQLEQMQKALTLAEYSTNALAEGNVQSAVKQALEAIPSGENILEAPVTAQAQKALTDALGVYDLSDGYKALGAVELPSAPFDLAVSPDGTCFAAVYAYEAAIYQTENMQQIATLPVQESALSDVVFVDENLIVYAGSQGVTAYDLRKQVVLWTGDTATNLAVSADRTKVAAVDRDADHAVVYHISDGTRAAECSFGGRHLSVAANDVFADPKDDIFALNEDGSLLAASFSDGGLVIYDLEHPGNDLVIYEESDYRHFEGGFYKTYFAYVAEKGGSSDFGLIDTKEAVSLATLDSEKQLSIQTDEHGIYLANGNLLVRVEPDTMGEIELAYTDNVNMTAFSVGREHVLVATEDQRFSFYDSGAHRMSTENCKENCDFTVLAGVYAIVGNRNEPLLRVLKLEDHGGAQVLSYDAHYYHDEARISHDGRTAMLFSNYGFCIYDMEGTLLAEKELSDPEGIYDQQFRKYEDGSYLEVVWYDGTVHHYSAEDGSLLLEEQGTPPAKDLYEEFFIGEYRFASPLHGTPEVYHQETGKLVAVLEEDSYLTYVTQVGDHILTEYISAAGERYGLLLDNTLQKLAYLPGLCDVFGDMLVFDDSAGNLRQSRLYSLQELVALGENYR